MIPSRQKPTSPFNTQHDATVNFLQRPDTNRYLHQHQVEALEAIRRHFENDTAAQPSIALVVLPTGCGKTGVAVLAPYVLNTTRVLVITPSLTISKQIHEAFVGDETFVDGEKRDIPMFLVQRDIIKPEVRDYFRPSDKLITKSQEIKMCLHLDLIVVNAHKIGGQSRVKIEDIPDDRYDLVVVDEAHHYPAPTWKELIDHFPNSKRLFLTATPYHKRKYILPGNPPCYTLKREEAVERGVIRPVEFDEAKHSEYPGMTPEEVVVQRVHHFLNEHDQQHQQIRHQAMVLAQTKEDVNPAAGFIRTYNYHYPNDRCEAYVSNTPPATLTEFTNGNIRVLVVIGRLLEGFDRKHVSVVAIARNVAYSSRVLFAQFVGRAVRKYNKQDPVTAMIVSHEAYNQKKNFERFDEVSEDNDVDDY